MLLTTFYILFQTDECGVRVHLCRKITLDFIVAVTELTATVLILLYTLLPSSDFLCGGLSIPYGILSKKDFKEATQI